VFGLAASAVALALAGCSGSERQETQATEAAQLAACDRDCLIGVTEQYLAAVAQNDPTAAPLARHIAFVENLERLQPGEGLWQSASGGPTQFSIHVPDVQKQQAGWLGVVEQNGEPVMVAVRLKLVDGQITEAEHIVTPPAQGNLQNLQSVRPGLLATIPQQDRLPYGELIRIGATYYDALDDNDGSKTPFAADCQRLENGMITAGEGVGPPPNWQPGTPRTARDCAGQLDSQTFVYIDRIENRRMVAADPVTGLSMGFSHFRHPMDNLPYKVTNEDGSVSERTAENMPWEPFDMPAAHIFKIGPDGLMREIEAVGVRMPYNSPTGWE